MDRRELPHIVIVYVLIVLLAALLIYTSLRVISMSNQEEQGTWQCSNVVCSQLVDPQEWVATNCARSILPNGTDYVACSIPIDGVTTSIPLEAINLSFVAEQCQVVTCVQEINVRPASYIIPLNDGAVPQ